MRSQVVPSVLYVLLLLGLVSRVCSLCPYHRVWLGDSLEKELADDPLHLQGTRRSLLQVDPAVGVGSCEYTNPITQQKSCVQFTGPAWGEEPNSAESKCTVEGVIPGTVDGIYAAGKLCSEFEQDGFAGVCISSIGDPSETRTVMVAVEGSPFGSCDALKMACETFAQGIFSGAGGVCGKEEKKGSKEKKGNKKGRKQGPPLSEEEPARAAEACQLNPGIAGGGHMDVESHWDETCENQGNQYALPLKWGAVLETIGLQKDHRTIGNVYYDSKNNRKRHDSVHVGGASSGFMGMGNSTIIHDHNHMSIMNWGTGVCVKIKLVVGNLRPNWVIDNFGAGAVSQYLGAAYIMYDGEFRNVRQWRKVEPLENAFMVVSYDEENAWATPEGIKRKVLRRITPGSPGAGDTVDIFYNHTTDFDDSVFDVLKGIECRSFSTGMGGGGGGGGGGFGLNLKSGLEIDSAFERIECEECGISYTDDRAGGKDADEKPDTRPDAKYFSGSKVVRKDPYLKLSWEYTPQNDTFTFSLKSKDVGGWLGLSFPKFKCAMVPAEGVIAASKGDDSEFTIGAYFLKVASLRGILVDNEQKLESAEVVNGDGTQTLTFTRKADNGGKFVLDPSAPIDVLWAVGATSELGYHGSGRGCFTISGDTS